MSDLEGWSRIIEENDDQDDKDVQSKPEETVLNSQEINHSLR